MSPATQAAAERLSLRYPLGAPAYTIGIAAMHACKRSGLTREATIAAARYAMACHRTRQQSIASAMGFMWLEIVTEQYRLDAQVRRLARPARL